MLEYIDNIIKADYLNPNLLWLFVPAILIFIYSILKSKGKLFSNFIRLIIFSCLIIIAANPVINKTEDSNKITALLDSSFSISKNAKTALLNSLEPFIKNSDLELFLFSKELDKNPILIKKSTPIRKIESEIESKSQKLNTGETNLTNAILKAKNYANSSSMLLLTDGFETSANTTSLLNQLNANETNIFPLIPNEKEFKKNKLSISSLYAPLSTTTGEVVEIRTSIKNEFNENKRAVLEVWDNEEKILAQTIQFSKNKEKLITLKTNPLKGGLHRIKTILRPLDNSIKPKEMHRWISAKEKSRILLLSGTKDDERQLKRLISLKGYAQENIVADGQTKIPTDLKIIPIS